ncbi:MAG: hypothetical protein M1835_003537 [Candelina submexicana]|nr:MAG: hypothetical protein M1835_003537 [Candelina submexicana]
MDPLSITASVIAVGTLTVKVGKGLDKLRSLREADDLLLALMNEVTTLRDIAGRIEAILHQHRESLSAEQLACSEQLERLLAAAKAKLEELDNIIHYQLLRAADKIGNEKLSRAAWFRHRSHVQRLQQELQRLQQNIRTLVATLNMSNTQRIEYRMEELYMFIRERDATHHEYHQASARTLARLAEQSNRMPAQVQHFQDQVEHIARHLRTTRLTGESKEEEPPKSTGSPHAPTPGTTVGIGLVQEPENQCARLCSCICHKPGRLSISFLDRVIGSLFVGYVGLPVFTAPCNEYICKKNRHRSSFSARFTYYFPSWFLARMIYSAINYTARDGPQILFVKAPRLRPGTARIFEYAVDGDIVAMQKAFSMGDASPFDVDANYTVIHNRIELSQLLIREGADVYLEDEFHESAYSLAWDLSLAWEERLSEGKRALPSIFEDTDPLDERRFSLIHRIVLGIDEGKLEYHLGLPNSCIDYVDSSGRTALSWAAARGDLYSVQKLLAHGADPNICATTNGRSPLQYASFIPGGVTLIQALLDAEGIADVKDFCGLTPLHNACSNGNIQSVGLLLDSGVYINPTDRRGYTPLHNAVIYTYVDVVRYLLERGADIDRQNDNGWTALHGPVERNHYRILRTLLRFSPNYSLRTRYGYTVLHFAAVFGDIQTLEILTEARMRGLPHDAKDTQYDKTAEEWAFKNRSDESQEWWGAFDTLLNSVVEDGEPVHDESSTDSDGSQESGIEEAAESDRDEPVFEDALEEPS